MALTKFELDAEARDKRKVEALERLAAAAERIAAALKVGQTKTTPAASEKAGRAPGWEVNRSGRRTPPKP